MASKILDGLFLGDALSSMDLNFIVANKITRVVNCAGKELENRWRAFGVAYLTFDWTNDAALDLLRSGGVLEPATGRPETIAGQSGADAERVRQQQDQHHPRPEEEDDAAKVTALDLAQVAAMPDCPCSWLHELTVFILTALERGEGVLVHSQDGQNRACSCVLAYVMTIYGWDLRKSISFLQSKRLDLLPSQQLYDQLMLLSSWLEIALSSTNPKPASTELMTIKFRSWDIEHDDLRKASRRPVEELVLHNTFLNSGTLLLQEEDHVRHTEERHESKAAGGDARGQLRSRGPSKVLSQRRVRWIDTSNAPGVLRSPFSKRPIPERPPGPSYSGLRASGGWQELALDEEDHATDPRETNFSSDDPHRLRDGSAVGDGGDSGAATGQHKTTATTAIQEALQLDRVDQIQSQQQTEQHRYQLQLAQQHFEREQQRLRQQQQDHDEQEPLDEGHQENPRRAPRSGATSTSTRRSLTSSAPAPARVLQAHNQNDANAPPPAMTSAGLLAGKTVNLSQIRQQLLRKGICLTAED
ncbi:Putative tyrosine phosphatase 123R, partial [Durusdinium trenchii]